MSDSHAHDGPHEGPIKTPKQLVLAVVFSFIVPIFLIVLLVKYVATDNRPAAGSDGLGEEAVARRIQPIGSIQVKDASDASALKTGEQVFTAQCSACHASGAAGAPKFGDTAAWAPRIAKGIDVLHGSAINGFMGQGMMPPKGGRPDIADDDIKAAVDYMVAGSK